MNESVKEEEEVNRESGRGREGGRGRYRTMQVTGNGDDLQYVGGSPQVAALEPEKSNLEPERSNQRAAPFLLPP